MPVPVNSRSKSKLEVCVKARELCVYTIKITSNKNVFTEEFQKPLTDRIVDTAIRIHYKCWEANNIYVKTDDDRRERLRLQGEAARLCNVLLSLMDIAKPVFHLKSQRIIYWGSLTVETRNLIRAWRESDEKRYGT